MALAATVGEVVGAEVAATVGETVGVEEGVDVGEAVGEAVGAADAPAAVSEKGAITLPTMPLISNGTVSASAVTTPSETYWNEIVSPATSPPMVIWYSGLPL